MSEAVREAGCACGRLTLRARGEPRLVGLCHCQACQRRTGSAFGLAAFFDEAKVEMSGETSTFARVADSGATLTYRFCPGCGSSLWWTRSSWPGVVAVAAGMFADPAFPGPSRRVWTDYAHDWFGSLSDLPTFPRQPTS